MTCQLRSVKIKVREDRSDRLWTCTYWERIHYNSEGVKQDHRFV